MTLRFTERAHGENTLARVGLALIGLHILDDSYLQPEPGTSAREHIVSGVVPLVMLIIAAAFYPRVRAGTRAVVALFFGFFGIAAGAAEAGYNAFNGGFSGDDYTGLLALLAGVVLLLVGMRTLWKTRRLGERTRRRYVRRSLIGAAAAIVAVEIAFPIVFAYGYTHYGNSGVPTARLGAAYDDVTFTTSDGLKLAGWYVPSRNGAAVIAFPGRSGPQDHARMLIRHGYGVLLFDPRGNGESEGDPFRYTGTRDVRAALAYLRTRADVEPERIGGLGLSLGGELLLQTAAETDQLRAVVSEGAGIRSIREQMDKPAGLRKWLSVPFYASYTAAISVFSNHLPPPDLEDLVSRIAPRPIFLIYARNGLGGEELNRQFYEAARQPKAIWEISDAGHTDGLDAHPKEYERRVINFFDDALLG